MLDAFNAMSAKSVIKAYLRSKSILRNAVFRLSLVPILVVFIGLSGVLKTDAALLYAGLTYGEPRKLVDAEPTIEGNYGVTAQALGTRAAIDVWHGRLPLWNHYEGFGAPLLGEMQSAALFPPTWLMVLPHGQILEQALLQFIAGIGAFLFFRAFGIKRFAALVGGLVFEINGVYAWLRNAIYNPVAFLPWLFLSIEWNRAATIRGLPLRMRMPAIGLGGCVAAMSLYAGFPEEVYLYSLLLIAWVVFRLRGLTNQQKARYLTGLLLTGLLAICLSAPLLVAFVGYLRDAEVGIHTADGFGSIWLGSAGLIQYLTPYIYGLIFSSKDPVIIDIWSSTGGYIGFVPVILAFASLVSQRHRATKLFLITWVVIALGVTHGLPGVYHIFMLLPLTKVAAVFRYLNVSWIFCLVFMSVIYIDDATEMSINVFRKTMLIGLSCSYVVIVLAVLAAWPLMSTLLSAKGRGEAALSLTLVSVLVLSGAVWLSALGSQPSQAARRLSGVLLFEASALFFMPYLSYPRAGKIDSGLVRFLRQDAGYQRVLNSTEGSLTPNYGSYFGISTLNYDDLPAPQLTAHYIKRNLDPYASSIAYGPFPDGLTPEQQTDWKKQFRAHLPAYAKAGVGLVLAGKDFGLVELYDWVSDGGANVTTYPLQVGQQIELTGRTTVPTDLSSSEISIALNEDRVASGHIGVTLCAKDRCAKGQADLNMTQDDGRLPLFLDRRIVFHPGDLYTIRLERIGGDSHVDLPFYSSASTATAPTVTADPPTLEGLAPDIRFADDNVQLAYKGQLTNVYKLPETRPYMSANHCEIKPWSRDELDTLCLQPSTLTRLELTMEGWSASINGRPVSIGTSEDIFQTVELPAGASRVEFRFAPRYFRSSLVIACFGLISVVVIFAKASRPIRIYQSASLADGPRNSDGSSALRRLWYGL